MNRRELLKSSFSLGGAFLAGSSLGLSSKAMAATSNHNWVFVTAQGGWDPAHHWDPKGKEIQSSKGSMTRYSESDIRKAGNIRYAPVPPGVTNTKDWLHTFTQKHYRRMTVLNGVDMGVNSHGIGTRLCMSGTQAKGSPSSAAFMAAPFGSSQAMAFIHKGGYSGTQGIVSASKVLSKSNYDRLSDPNHFLDSDDVYHHLMMEKERQHEKQIDLAESERMIASLEELYTARNSKGDFKNLLSSIPGSLSSNSNKAAGQIAAAAFASGQATSAAFSLGGFDTHSNNDAKQFEKMDELLELVDFIWEQVELQRIADKTTIFVASDMGRKPYYSGNGKGHWSISSMLAMGAGVTGNRVIGGTDNNMKPIKIDPVSLKPSDNGTVLNPASVHDALRRIANMDGSALDQRYPLNSEYIKIF